VNTQRDWLRMAGLVSLAVLIPVVPFLVLGQAFEESVLEWIRAEWSPGALFAGIVGLLGLDLLLPVPSSAVSTYAGGQLGFVAGASASIVGMTLGAVSGYALARLWGGRIVARAAGDDVRLVAPLALKWGAMAIVLTRALPILAEACVLLMGLWRLPWRQFLPPLLLSNLAISLTYAAFGALLRERDALPAAVAASVFLPLVVAMVVRQRLRSSAAGRAASSADDAPSVSAR
jgi:uncharacterized membrane protein YdjX (TVP38/TMEM64 family)